jgi:hypothetical protein
VKVFISWSGQRSLAIAKAIYDWLPRVIQTCEPWMSDSDADKGIRWMQTIGSKLEQYNFGIFCLTPENLDSRWINFEAGALSKAVEKSYVWTYLFNLKYTDIEGPLSQFNHTLAEKEDTKKLVRTMYRASSEQAPKEEIVDDAFETYWGRLEESLRNLPLASERSGPPRKVEDKIDEILELVRHQYQAGPNQLLIKSRPRFLSTLDWSPEDARMLSDFYNALPEKSKKSISFITTNKSQAKHLLTRIKEKMPLDDSDMVNLANDFSLDYVFEDIEQKDENSNS